MYSTWGTYRGVCSVIARGLYEVQFLFVSVRLAYETIAAMIDETRLDAVFVVRITRVRFGGNLGHELPLKNQTDQPLSELSILTEFAVAS